MAGFSVTVVSKVAGGVSCVDVDWPTVEKRMACPEAGSPVKGICRSRSWLREASTANDIYFMLSAIFITNLRRLPNHATLPEMALLSARWLEQLLCVAWTVLPGGAEYGLNWTSTIFYFFIIIIIIIKVMLRYRSILSLLKESLRYRKSFWYRSFTFMIVDIPRKEVIKSTLWNKKRCRQNTMKLTLSRLIPPFVVLLDTAVLGTLYLQYTLHKFDVFLRAGKYIYL